ncbi:MAG: LamG-like jellyroll fold domain-containing protein [Verrucomicrobiota bacterium]
MKLFSLLLMTALVSGVSVRAQLLHRYDFETAGAANDKVGTAHGTLRGTATVSAGALNTTGVIGGLSGGVPQNGVSLPASAVAGLTNAFSLEIWYTANFNGGYSTLFSFSSNGTANYLLATPARGVSPFQSSIAANGGGGNAGEQLANQIYGDTGILHDMVVTFDGTNVTYYLDGTLPTYAGLQNAFTDAGLNLSTLTNIGIAGGSPYADNTINGQVHDFRIYGRALTLNEVAAMYELGAMAAESAISNLLVTPPSFGVSFTGNLVRMPFYGSVGLHDPGTLVKEGGRYFVYGDGTGIGGITSTNLRNWTAAPAVFPSGPPAWTTNAVPGGTPNYFWAPDLAYFNGLWHMYYSYSQWATRNSVIGVAVSPSLTNPAWTDLGKVVKSSVPVTADTDTSSYNCIDPSIYVAANGRVWMSYGSYSSGILVTQIDPATSLRLNSGSLGTQVASNGPGGGEGNTEEASCLYQHGGYWYLFVNFGGCCDLTYSTYNIRVGRSASPTGPYLDRNGINLNAGGGTMFLESTARYIGPGHPAVTEDNGTNWFIYHFYDGLANGFPTVGMNQLFWSADGWPVLTNEWSALYPLAGDANEASGIYHGTLRNGAGFTNDPARGKVLQLDGVTNYVSLPLSVGNASTFATWVNWRGGAAWQRIFDFGNDTTNYFFLTPASSGGTMRFAIRAGGSEQQINAAFALPTNSWHHVAVTLDGSRGILYYDGAPVATNAALTIRPWQTVPHSNHLGKSQFAADPFFAGNLSSFRSFGRALSPAEINAMFQAHPALSHRYSFGTNAPSAVWDSVGLAHGTLKGNAVVTNNSLKLTGATGGYVDLPNSLVSGCSVVTLEFWATLGVNGSWARIFDTGNINGAVADHYFFFSPHNGSGGQRFELNTSSVRTFDIPGTLDNRTVHVVAICDPSNNYLGVYTNGVLEKALTNSLPPVTGVANAFSANAWSFIGRSLWPGDAYLNGTIDELRLYAGRLTPQQIAANYVAGPGVLQPPSVVSTNLVFVRNGAVMTLSWPADHVGWRLQAQTNSASTGLGNQWTDVPGSVLTNNIVVPVDASVANVFFRLVYP